MTLTVYQKPDDAFGTTAIDLTLSAQPPTVNRGRLGEELLRRTWPVELGERLDPCLGQFCSGARVIGLGESTHGTHEFFTGRAAIAQSLIVHHGVRHVLIEAPFSASLVLNALINGASGDIREAIRQRNYCTWGCEEMVQFLQFLRRWNRENASPVTFLGIDGQDYCAAQVARMLPHIWPEGSEKRVGTILALADRLYEKEGEDRERDLTLPNGPFDALKREVTELRTRLPSPATTTDARYAHELLASLVEHFELLRQTAVSGYAAARVRDQLMAERLVRLIDAVGESAPTVVFAHNGHISRDGAFRSSMGYHLEQVFGDAYRSLALFTARGSNVSAGQSHERRNYKLTDAIRSSVEFELDAVCDRASFLDLRDLGEYPVLEAWAHGVTAHRAVGWAAIRSEFQQGCLANSFDGLLFFPETRGYTVVERAGESTPSRQNK